MSLWEVYLNQNLLLKTTIFESEINEFNQNIAFLNLNDLEDFFDLNKNNRYLEVFLKDPKILNPKINFQSIYKNELC